MDKLRISLKLKSPLIHAGGYMTLDALLASVVFDQTADLYTAHSQLPLHHKEGLWFASAVIYESIEHSGFTFVANIQAHHWLDHHLVHKKPDGTLQFIGTARKQDFGPVLNNYQMVTTDSVSWYAMGDADKIYRLLKDIEFIGKRRASGFGQVEGLTIEPDELDGVVGPLGEPLRPVPVDMFFGDTASIKADASWRPAYWDLANRAICYVPGENL